MSYDDDWPDQTLENRRKVVKETIRPATLRELKDLGVKRFPIVTDPWCERFNAFLTTHANAKFYIAASPEGHTRQLKGGSLKKTTNGPFLGPRIRAARPKVDADARRCRDDLLPGHRRNNALMLLDGEGNLIGKARELSC